MQVSVFSAQMLFQLDVFDELFCRGGMELEEQGNLPVVNGKTLRQRRDAAPDSVAKYRLLIYYPAAAGFGVRGARGCTDAPLTHGWNYLDTSTGSHWHKQDAKNKIIHEPFPWVSLEMGLSLNLPLCIP